MRFLLFIICCSMTVFLKEAVADEMQGNWTFLPSNFPIVVTEDFCELCGCCRKAPVILKFSKGALPKSFGTAKFPPMMRMEMLDDWQKRQSDWQTMPPEIMKGMLSGAATRALADVCEICKCCIKTQESLVLGKGKGAKLNLEQFGVFME